MEKSLLAKLAELKSVSARDSYENEMTVLMPS